MQSILRDSFAGISYVILWSGISALAQTPPLVRVTVDATPLRRGRTSIVPVHVAIPPGYYVPAETLGTLRAAWVRVVDRPTTYFMSREAPTYPIPDRVLLPVGAHAVSARAYRDTVSIPVPVEVPPGGNGKQVLSIEVGFQLCDLQACRSFSTAEARTDVMIVEPDVPKEYIAYTLDPTHVAILVDHEVAEPEDAKSLGRPIATFGAELAGIPNDLAGIPATQAKGSAWMIQSDGRRFEAVVERFGAAGSDAQHAQLALVARVVTPTFQNEGARYFLASSRELGQTLDDSPSITRPDELTNAQRQSLENLIDSQMRITLPSVFAPGYLQARPSTYDERVLAGKAKLVYHLEAFKLAADADTRLFVRAYWVVGPQAQTGLTLWIRIQGGGFVVERTDASLTRFARLDIIERDRGLDAAADTAGFAGFLLNVIQASDGFAYVIMKHRGYESLGIRVLKYSADGPLETGIGYAEGA